MSDVAGLAESKKEALVKKKSSVQVSVVIPAYNEEEAIGEDLNIIKQTLDQSDYTYEIIVIDDGSTDNTAAIACEKGVTVIRHPFNRGSGASRKTGILQAKGEYIVMTDADGTYPNRDIPKLLAHLPEYDHVVGARTSEQGTWKYLRQPTKWFIRKLACYLTGTPIPDLNSGLRAFKRDIMMKYIHLLPLGFSCVTTMTMSFLSGGHTVKYVPVPYYKRKGRSKFHPIKDTYNYLLTVIRMVMYFEPLKIFLPLSVGIFAVAAVRLFYDVFILYRVREFDIVIVLTGVLSLMLGLLADLIVRLHKRD